jgi:hypothetical protein
MADVVLGRAGDTVLVDLDICVKTGQVTKQRVTLRGRTTPGWVIVLLFLTIIGFLFVSAMTSRRYRVTLPFSHEIYDRWRNYRRLAWVVGLIGVGTLVAAATSATNEAGPWVVTGLSLTAGALLIGTINAVRNFVGFRVSRDGELLLTGAHPAFVAATRAASTSVGAA